MSKKKVYKFSTLGNLVGTYDSISKTGMYVKSGRIGACCNRRSLFCGGYIWRYSNDPLFDKYEIGTEEFKDALLQECLSYVERQKVIQYTLDGEIVKKWDNSYLAAKSLNCHIFLITRAMISKKEALGFKWDYNNSEIRRR